MKKSVSLLVICTYLTVLGLTQANAAMTMGTSSMTNGTMSSGLGTMSNGDMTTSDDEDGEDNMTSTSSSKAKSSSSSKSSRGELEDSDYKELEGLDGNTDDLTGPNKINGDLTVANFTFNGENGNLIVTGNADGSQFDYDNGNVYIDGDLTYANVSGKGNVFVKGNVDSSSIDIDGDLYVYGKLDCANLSVTGKIKVAKDSDGASLEKGKFYSFGKKVNFANVGKDQKPETGLFAKVDPLLQIDLADDDYNEVKTKLVNATKEIEKLKKDLLLSYGKYKKGDLEGSKIADIKDSIVKIKSDALDFAEKYLEDTDFDKEQFKKLRNFEQVSTKAFLAKYELKSGDENTQVKNGDTVSTQTDDSTLTTTSQSTTIEAKAVLPEKLKKAIDRLVDKYNTDEKKTKVLNTLITKIGKLTEGKEVNKKIALLIALSDYCKEKLNEVNGDVSDDVLNSLIQE